MPFQPFPYQAECLARLSATRRRGNKTALVVMASGLGKTVTAALDAKRFLASRKGRLLYLCHQNDILRQARATFEAILGSRYSYGYYHGEGEKSRSVDCLFASFQTMRQERRKFRKRDFAYIVVDESHHGPAPTYQPTIEYFQPSFLLGITATPERSDLQDICRTYGEEVYSLPIEEALAQGYLTTVDYRLMTDELQNLSLLNTQVGRLSVKLLNKKLFIPRRDEEIARLILQRASELANPRIMVFCPSIVYCERLAAHLPSALPLHSDLGYREQRTRLDLFRQGAVNCVLTVDKLNEGIDVPDANVIVFLRSTASRIVFFQQLGRGLRKLPEKSRVIVLDFVANCERLEMINELWRDVDRRRTELPPTEREVAQAHTPISVDIGSVRFSEMAIQVLDVLRAMRGGYTRGMLISQLQQLAKTLNRKPTTTDVRMASQAGKMASQKTFSNVFGSFNNAMLLAGFVPRNHNTTDTKILEQLRALVKVLGRAPEYSDVTVANQAGKCVGINTIIRRFGTLPDALKAAKTSVGKRQSYGREILLKQLRNLAKKLGRTPIIDDLLRAKKTGSYANPGTFVVNFGSWHEALIAAGLTPTRKKRRKNTRRN